jgi:adenine phosphoribosyltransferase
MPREVMVYEGQAYHEVNLFGLTRRFPLVEVGGGMWIASNAGVILGDIEFISKAAEAIVNKVSRLVPEVIVAPEAKSIALSYEVGKKLGHKKIVIARKSVKAYMKNYVVETLKSITTSGEQVLVLSGGDLRYLEGKRVCILDDVVSTGGTIRALERLVRRAKPLEIFKAVIWKEGPWYKSGDLLYLDVLPVYVEKK